MAKVKKPKKEDLEKAQLGQGLGSTVNQGVSDINHSNYAVTTVTSRG
jgi:hypothetical protein